MASADDDCEEALDISIGGYGSKPLRKFFLVAPNLWVKFQVSNLLPLFLLFDNILRVKAQVDSTFDQSDGFPMILYRDVCLVILWLWIGSAIFGFLFTSTNLSVVVISKTRQWICSLTSLLQHISLKLTNGSFDMGKNWEKRFDSN